MAVAFINNNTEHLERNAGTMIPFASDYTWSAWFRPSVLTWNLGYCILHMVADLTVRYDGLFIGNTNQLHVFHDTGSNGGYAAVATGSVDFVAGTWAYVTLRRSGNQVQGLLNGVQVLNVTCNVAGRATPDWEGLGTEDATGSDFAGRIAAEMVWTTALTDAQVLTQMRCQRPIIRTDVLWRWSPLFTTGLTGDYSGNARSWTVTGTADTEDGPPVSWGAQPLFRPNVATLPELWTRVDEGLAVNDTDYIKLVMS